MRYREFLTSITDKKTIFVGLGNEERGDDAIGLYIIKSLATKIKKKLKFLLAYTTPENYLKQIIDSEPDIICFIDAVRSNKKEGTISLLGKDEISSAAISTHTSSIKMIIQFLQNSCKAKIYVIAISIKQADFKTKLTPKIKNAADELIAEAENIFA